MYHRLQDNYLIYTLIFVLLCYRVIFQYNLGVLPFWKLLLKAIMKLACQSHKRMRELSSLWVPPIYRRLLSADKPERDMAERCLIKVSCVILPPQPLLSKVIERLLLLQLCLIHSLIYLVSNYLSIVCKFIGYMHTVEEFYFSLNRLTFC
jgi:hypothetical protein